MDREATIKSRGWLTIELRDADGKIKYKKIKKNTLTNTGFAASAARLMDNTTEAAFDYIAVGTDDGTILPLAAGNTALGAEIVDPGGAGLIRANDATPTRSDGAVTNDTTEINVTFNVSGSKSVAEYGLFNAAVSGGVMLARQLDTALPLVSGDQLSVTWKIQHTA